MLMNRLLFYVLMFLVVSDSPATAGSVTRTLNQIAEIFRQTDTSIVTDDSISIMSYSFINDSFKVEAILVKPPRAVKAPAIVLIPGYDLTAADFISKAVRFARAGFICLTITEPGFGRSEGKPDLCGLATLGAVSTGVKKLIAEPGVDSSRLGIMGYARGATTASLLATRTHWFRAAAFVGGIYDFKHMYEKSPIPDIKAAIANEIDPTPDALEARSSLSQMAKLSCPVLIVHGVSDINSPPTQALALREELDKLRKPYEFHLLGGKKDPSADLSPLELSVAFFQKILAGSN